MGRLILIKSIWIIHCVMSQVFRKVWLMKETTVKVEGKLELKLRRMQKLNKGMKEVDLLISLISLALANKEEMKKSSKRLMEYSLT